MKYNKILKEEIITHLKKFFKHQKKELGIAVSVNIEIRSKELNIIGYTIFCNPDTKKKYKLLTNKGEIVHGLTNVKNYLMEHSGF